MTAALPTWRDWLFSAKAFAASMLALYVALAAGLPRPYWAMAAVYVVANPLSGATRSKALYRALGTFIGAAGAVLLVPPLVNAPELLSLAVALWTGGFLFVSLLDRTPRSYVFMLAGYSLPLIALPAVGDPGSVFDLAVARSLEITLGIVCASVVNSVILPTAVGPTLANQVDKWRNGAAEWTAGILGSGDPAAAAEGRLRLAADVRGLELLIGQIAYDPAARRTARHARELQARLAMLLPILSSLGDRIGAARAAGADPQGFDALRADVLRWIEDPAVADPDGLRRRIAALEEEVEGQADWGALVLAGALARMRDLVDLWQDIEAAQRRIVLGERAQGREPAPRFRNVFARAPHYDFGLLAFSAGSVVLATLLASFVWIESGWVEGSGCVIMTAVGASFFAALDDPVPQIKAFTIWMGISIAVSGFYIFAVLPQVHGFEMLVAVFAVPFLLFGTLVGRPQFTLIAMLLAVNTASFVGVQETYSADFASFLNGNLASVAGGLFGLAWTMATRPFGAALAARRLLRASWRDVASIARGGSLPADGRFAGRMLDRSGQLAPRLAALPDGEAPDALGELRLGLNLIELKRVRRDGRAAPAVGELLAAVGDLFTERARTGRRIEAPERIRVTIDAALSEAAVDRSDAGRATLNALVGIRRALFPAARPPTLPRPVEAFEPPAYSIAAE
ncbi:FUSC family protein [Aureimonas leprariae]|uniref:FUSC family protein n=1 Tax=Plantimonas leprariae TaxID=2615207 RepID=A0A7V7PML4_9HYPH|nr:FUSC family protein [Aureimonas leprariae]KAB0678476.1 FUSC family protein [Aureimonas leprariae]